MWPPKDFPVCGGPEDYVSTMMIPMPVHWHTKTGRRYFNVDACIANEIMELTHQHGVRTIECCCGHGRDTSYIAVDKQSVKLMKKLGYELEKDSPEEIKGTVFLPKNKIIHIGPERKHG